MKNTNKCIDIPSTMCYNIIKLKDRNTKPPKADYTITKTKFKPLHSSRKKAIMKLKEVKKWTAVHFEDRGILPVDKKYYTPSEWERLLNLEVEPTEHKGHYKVVNK